MSRHIFLLLVLAVVFPRVLAASEDTSSVIENRYCTEYGPFSIRIDNDKIAGFYAVLTHGHIGSMVGVVRGHEVEGRWAEVSSHGDIRMTFSADWSSFSAQYNISDNKSEWYSDWNGMLPDRAVQQFDRGGVTYRCN